MALTLCVGAVHGLGAAAWVGRHSVEPPAVAAQSDPQVRSPGLIIDAVAVPAQIPVRLHDATGGGSEARAAVPASTPPVIPASTRSGAADTWAMALPAAPTPRAPPEPRSEAVVSTPVANTRQGQAEPAAAAQVLQPAEDLISDAAEQQGAGRASDSDADPAAPSRPEAALLAPERHAQAAPPGGRSLPAAQPGASQAPIVPVYATRLPAAQRLSYELKRGVLSGTGELLWQHDGQRYQAALEGRVAGFSILTWRSEGRIDSAGLAPVRYTDKRRGSAEQAANFQRDKGTVVYSGPSVEYPVPRGGQDRLSWMVQIAAILEARAAQPPAAGERLSIWVSGARGDADVWAFRALGVQTVVLSGQPVATLAFVREPREPYDTRVEVWLDPARQHLPVLARLGSARGDDVLELRLLP